MNKNLFIKVIIVVIALGILGGSIGYHQYNQKVLATQAQQAVQQKLLAQQEKLKLEKAQKDKEDKKAAEQKALQEKQQEEQRLIDEKKKQEEQRLADEKKKQEEAAVSEKAKNETHQNKAEPKQVVQATSLQPTNSPVADLIINGIHGVGISQQAIVVTTSSWDTCVATLQTFEKINGAWKRKFAFMGASVGKKGFAKDKHEGDMKSPIGIYSFGVMFGTANNPGVKYEYRKTNGNQFWVDDCNSPLYNTWQEGPSNGRWNSAENLYIPAYTYAAVIKYNTSARTPGKGSAIFFHVGGSSGTAGCVATSQSNLVQVLNWMDPVKNPIIIMGPESVVTGF